MFITVCHFDTASLKTDFVMKGLRLSSVLLLGCLIPALHTGCSIKEDRSACPCALILDFGGVDRDRSDSLSLAILSPDGFLYHDIVRSDSYGSLYRVDVPKGELLISAFGGESGEESPFGAISQINSSMDIPYGEECPEVNSFYLHTFFGDETVTVPVILHKNYCMLSVTMAYEEVKPLGIAIVGDVCGYDPDGAPVTGDFLFEPYADGGIFHVSIPRQTDSSLKLNIFDEDEILREFAVGEYIAESGFDWTAEDLGDVDIEIDYAVTRLTVRVNGWSKTVEIETVI